MGACGAGAKLDSGERLVLPELDLINWKGRTVELIPDSDGWRPDKLFNVLGGFYALARVLTDHGAAVRFVKLPESTSVKVGLDDWLVAEGPLWQDGWKHLERVELCDARLKKIFAWYQKWARKQARLAMSLTGALVDRVNAIRLDEDLKRPERKRAISSVVLQDLEARGTLIRTREDELYFFDRDAKALEGVEGGEFLSQLYARFGLNPTEEETRFIESDIHTKAMCQGLRARVHRVAHWDKQAKKLYVNANNGTMFLLDGHSIDTVDNGTNSVLFLSDPKASPIVRNQHEDPEAFNIIFHGLHLTDDSASGRAGPAQSLALLKVWALAIFFLEAIPVRPLLTLIGEQGSGKTTFGRRLGLMIEGPEFEVGSFRSDTTGEQDFLATVTAKRLVVFDNADARLSWLPDHLSKLATGSEIKRRKLYTTNDLVCYRPECFLMLTTREPKWRRDDVVRRVLPIRMETIQAGKKREATLQQEILDQRPTIWGAMLEHLNAVVAAIQEDTGQFESHHRLADFNWFGNLAAPVLGIPDEFHQAMEALERTQLNVLGEGNEQLELLARWLDSHPEAWTGKAIITGDLLGKLRDEHVGPDRDFPFKGAGALGTWLGRHKDLIWAQLQVRVEKDFIGHVRGWSFAKSRCEDVKAANPQENKGKCDLHTFTPSSDETVGGTVIHEEERRIYDD